MELFSEIYSSYYRAVAEVLRQAQERPLSGGDIQKILSESTFAESALTIWPKLQKGNWPLLRKTEEGYRAACLPPFGNPLTALQQAWLKAVLHDPRMELFFAEPELANLRQALAGVEPLYSQEDFHHFDQTLDPDDYSSPDYQQHFRLVLSAIRQKNPLLLHYEVGKGKRVRGVFWPCKLEYSQRDDKFRAYCRRQTGSHKMLYTLNLGRIVSAEPVDRTAVERSTPAQAVPLPQFHEVVIEITRERNALERCMVHFAHFEKRTEYDERVDKYISTIRYNVLDETEVLIRVLSFGPTIKVVAPQEFVAEIKARVQKQTELFSASSRFMTNT